VFNSPGCCTVCFGYSKKLLVSLPSLSCFEECPGLSVLLFSLSIDGVLPFIPRSPLNDRTWLFFLRLDLSLLFSPPGFFFLSLVLPPSTFVLNNFPALPSLLDRTPFYIADLHDSYYICPDPPSCPWLVWNINLSFFRIPDFFLEPENMVAPDEVNIVWYSPPSKSLCGVGAHPVAVFASSLLRLVRSMTCPETLVPWYSHALAPYGVCQVHRLGLVECSGTPTGPRSRVSPADCLIFLVTPPGAPFLVAA